MKNHLTYIQNKRRIMHRYKTGGTAALFFNFS